MSSATTLWVEKKNAASIILDISDYMSIVELPFLFNYSNLTTQTRVFKAFKVAPFESKVRFGYKSIRRSWSKKPSKCDGKSRGPIYTWNRICYFQLSKNISYDSCYT